MSYKIDNFNFPDKTVENFNRVGITPDKIKSWIKEGRNNSISDEGIKSFIIDKFHELNAPYERGGNLGGGIRVVLSETPFIGTWADEAEAAIRSGSFGGENYDKYLKNARESVAGANAKLARGDWLARNAGLGLKIAENSLGAILSGGVTLLPQVSAAQGAIEGYGAGQGTAQRAILGGAGGAIGYAVPAIMNKILPTKSVQNAAIKKYTTPKKDAITPLHTKGDNILTSLAIKAMKKGQTPEQVLAQDMTRATKDTLREGIKSGASANKYAARPVFDSAAKNVDTPYVEYMTNAVKNASPKYANKLGEELAKIGLENGDDVLMYADVRPQVIEAINTAMRGADDVSKEAVSNAAEKAIGERAAAKMLVKTLKPSSYGVAPFKLTLANLFNRYISYPFESLLNKGTANLLTGKTLLDDSSRSVADTILKQALGPRRY